MVTAEIKLQTFNNINILEWFEISLRICKIDLNISTFLQFRPKWPICLSSVGTRDVGPIQCLVVVNYPLHHGRNLVVRKINTSRHFKFSSFSCQTALTDGALEAVVYILTGFAADRIISHKKQRENFTTRLQC